MKNRCTLHRKDDTWLDTRRRYITSTDAAAVMGVDPRRSIAQLLYDKLHGSPHVDNEHTRRGVRMEPHIVKLWEKTTLPPNKVRSMNGWYAISSEYPWMLSSPDAVFLSGSGEAVILEVKCPQSLYRYCNDKKQLEAYRWQVVHQIVTMGVRHGVLFAAEENLRNYQHLEITPTDEERNTYVHRSAEMHSYIRSGRIPLERW